jgi:hypothetical protein
MDQMSVHEKFAAIPDRNGIGADGIKRGGKQQNAGKGMRFH